MATLPAVPAQPLPPYLRFDPVVFREGFDREPFEFTHSLSALDLFREECLYDLAEKFADSSRDYFIAGSAWTPGTKFYDVPSGGRKPLQALESLDKLPCRILLKRPEDHDGRFRDLLEALFKQVTDLRGGMDAEHVVRLESALLISSGCTTTPVHFDPEVGFFSQIEGEKFYHVYPPACAQETELEKFYVRGRVDIGAVDFAKLDSTVEHVYTLGPGKGFHQPQNSPHWVQTGTSRSVSFTFVYETNASRARGRTRAFNYCMRKVGVTPSRLGLHPSADAAKAAVIRAAKPIQLAGRVWNKAQRVLGGTRLRSH
jgi:hypothetical protein